MEITKSKTTYYKETVPEDLEGFKNWQFTSGGTTGADFKVFARLFVSNLNKQLKGAALRICNYSAGHYILSGFVTNGEKFVYFSISDVRHFPSGWHNDILIRTAKDDKDYTGGTNRSCSLADFAQAVSKLF